jgi:hypothetical protein
LSKVKNSMTASTRHPGRRDFITAVTALSAGATYAGPVRAWVVPLLPALQGTSCRGASAFRAQLQSEFSVAALGAGGAQQRVRLVAVAPLAYAHPALSAGQRDELAFSITLASASSGLAQDTYALSHPVLGDFAALLVPSRDGRELTGIFHLPA